uniref:protein phosphatase methylesterase-1 n=1 Tax=Arcella intermedia TaxID=1963864 RepID=A0A6B2LD61_9EUKA
MYFSSKEMLDSGFCVYKAGDDGPMVFLIHGAGLGAMSWAPVVKLLKDHCRVITFDCRGHGSTLLTEDDMSSENLVNDTKGIIEKLNPTGSPIVLIGHSMGGAIAIRTALALPKNAVSALIVLDVVEGTAMAALPKMMSIIQGRPSKFDTVESALHWAVSSGVVRNRASACISVPQQFIEKDGCYVWRTDLRKTQPFWEGWFKNMSNLFLSVPCPKLLLVADTDRLDTPLTTGQMMGKFQFSIIPNVGHLIQEDAPERTATLIIQFLQRFRLTK